MKVLKRKIKNIKPAKKFFYYLTIILYIATFIYFIYGILHLKGIETLIRIIIIVFFSLWIAIYMLSGLITMIAKKNKSFVILTIITMLFCPIFGVSSYYITKIYNKINMVQENKIYTTNLIALKETNFDNSSIIGMIKSEEDIEGNLLAKKLIENEGLRNKVQLYDDYHEMIAAMYLGKIDACFVSANYAIIFENEIFTDNTEENNVPLAERVKVLFSYNEEMKNEDNELLSASKTKELTEPFSMLIMGVDSTIDGLKANQAFNGDTLILVTFNPNTLTATMFSIPRDLYVPIACNNNRYAKINSSAAYGSSCVINTVKKLTGIDIDYYGKINFTGVVKLVDALGGVTVDVQKPDFNFNINVDCKGKVCEQNSNREFGKEMIYIEPGIQTLNGEQALAYARNRHQYKMSDIARNQHQQDLIQALAQKVKELRSINDFENVLNAVSSNIETNMTPEQIMSFYSVAKNMLATAGNGETPLSIKKTYLSYYNLTVYRGYNAAALGYCEQSLNAIVDLMKVNLGLQKQKDIKTFNISYNENYETPLVGMGLYGGERLQTLPDFFGYDKEYVNTWCIENNVTCTFEEIADPAEYGQVVNQSVYANTLMLEVKDVIFYYSNGLGSNSSEQPETDTGNNDTSNNESENNENNNNDSDNENNNEEDTSDKDETTDNEKEENNKDENNSENNENSNTDNESNNSEEDENNTNSSTNTDEKEEDTDNPTEDNSNQETNDTE